MRAVHRFIVVSIVLLCGLLGPASQDIVPRVTARAAAAVIPADLIPPGVPSINDCPMVAPTLRPIWQYVREFLLARIRAVAEWFLSPRLDADSGVRYRSPRETGGKALDSAVDGAGPDAGRVQPAGRSPAAAPHAVRITGEWRKGGSTAPCQERT